MRGMHPHGHGKKQPLKWSNVWQDAGRLIGDHRYRLLGGLALLLVNRLAGLVLPASSKFLIDEVIGNEEHQLLTTLAFAVGGATIIQAASSFSISQLLSVAAQRAINDMRKVVHAHVTHLPVAYFDSTKTGILISRIMSDAEGVRNLVGTGFVHLIGGIITAGLSIAALFYLNWQLTLYILVALILFGGTMAYAFNYLRPIFRERHKLHAEITGRLTESMGGIRTVKAYVAEDREKQTFATGVDELFAKIAMTIKGISTVSALSVLIVGVVGMLMMIVGGRAILAGSMTLGDFVMYIFFTGMVAAPVVQMASIGTQVTEAFAGLDRIREVMNEAKEHDGGEPCDHVTGDIEFQDVSFEYQPGKPVLHDVSFTAPAGSTTALVGSSGAGKSTLVSLVMAFGRPVTGTVLVDGRELATMSLGEFRSHLGVVMQDNFLFDGTIAENIRFSRPEATMEQVASVGQIAHCQEFVNEFDDGYDTIVGERGVKLSGGQRQRIAIARALLADPQILILDEATSSLDSESEALIQDGLQRLRKGRTTFVIAHRLSTIRAADQILVMEEGTIVQRGTHDELVDIEGRYRELYRKQYRFEMERFVNPGEEFALTGDPHEQAVAV